MKNKKKNIGKIIIPSSTNIWPHELKTAKALIRYGHIVEFKVKNEEYKVHSADAFIDGEIWEFKSPNGNKLSLVEKNLRRAKNQSCNIVFDSLRVKDIPDFAIEREILSKAPKITAIDRIIFINRHRECIDIYKKIN